MELAPNAAVEVDTFQYSEQQLHLAALALRLDTSINEAAPAESHGLTDGQARARIIADGPNVLPALKISSSLARFAREFKNGFAILLLVASALSFIAYAVDVDSGKLPLGFICVAIAFLTCALNFCQARSTGNWVAAYARLLPEQVVVRRNGTARTLPSRDLVKGDIVLLERGDVVPADLRLISCQDLTVDCASFNGESNAVSFSADVIEAHVPYAHNIVLCSSRVLNGSGVGVVLRAGHSTVVGKVAALAREAKSAPALLQVEINRLAMKLSFLAVVLAVIVTAIGLARQLSVEYVILNCVIQVFVANVAEGLPLLIAGMLGISAIRSRRADLVASRPAMLATLGAASTICMDKTGSMTQGCMSVSHTWCNFTIHSITTGIRRSANSLLLRNRASMQAGLPRAAPMQQNPVADPVEPHPEAAVSVPLAPDVASPGDINLEGLDPAAEATAPPTPLVPRTTYVTVGNSVSLLTCHQVPSDVLSTVLGICNFAQFATGSTHGEVVWGNNVDAALLRYVDTLIPIQLLRAQYASVFRLPFNADNKFSFVVAKPLTSSGLAQFVPQQDDGTVTDASAMVHVAMMKGAPEFILGRCSHYLYNDVVKVMDAKFKIEHEAIFNNLAAAGEYVIGAAYRVMPARNAQTYQTETLVNPASNFVFLGLVSLLDPPRKEVKETIADLRDAGLKTVVFTGDSGAAAATFARSVGLLESSSTANALRGDELSALSEASWTAIVDRQTAVFARVSPGQKVAIIEQYQKRGHIVAAVGDGANDGPALKVADVGICMDQAGSPVTKDSADILLLNDDFAAIVAGIQIGRSIVWNIRMAVTYTLSHLWPEIVAVIIPSIFGLPQGLPPQLVLLIDLGSELAPAISYAMHKEARTGMATRTSQFGKLPLTTTASFVYAYGIVGNLQAALALCAYFLTFAAYGIKPAQLMFIADKYFKADAPDFLVNDKVYTSDEQQDIMARVHTAWYFTIVLCQFSHMWLLGSRKSSASCMRRLRVNWWMVASALLAVGFICLLGYDASANETLATASPLPFIWAAIVLFPTLLWGVIELSTWIAKRCSCSWYTQQFGW